MNFNRDTKRIKGGLIFSLMFIVTGLLAQDTVTDKIKIKEILSIGGLDSSVIYQWADIAVDESNCIYVIDFKDYSIKKFAPDGRLINKAGQKGEGPGEFTFPVKLKYCNGRLYVSQLHRPGIQIFDKELNYISSIPLRLAISDFCITPEDRIFVYGLGSPVSLTSIIVFDLKGNQLEAIPYDKGYGLDKSSEKYRNDFLNMINFDLDKDGNIIMAYETRDLIKKINRKGDILFEKSLLGRGKVEFIEVKKSYLPKELAWIDLELDTHGNIFVLSGDFAAHPRSDVYVLDQKGNLMAIFTLPESSHKIYIDHNNFLYSRSDEGMGIKKYEVLYMK